MKKFSRTISPTKNLSGCSLIISCTTQYASKDAVERTDRLLCIVPHILQYIVAPIELPSIKELHNEVKSGVLAVRTLQRLGSSRQSVARSEVGGTAAGRRGRDEACEGDANGGGIRY
jgi:hypothetical protein